MANTIRKLISIYFRYSRRCYWLYSRDMSSSKPYWVWCHWWLLLRFFHEKISIAWSIPLCTSSIMFSTSYVGVTSKNLPQWEYPKLCYKLGQNTVTFSSLRNSLLQGESHKFYSWKKERVGKIPKAILTGSSVLRSGISKTIIQSPYIMQSSHLAAIRYISRLTPALPAPARFCPSFWNVWLASFCSLRP